MLNMHYVYWQGVKVGKILSREITNVNEGLLSPHMMADQIHLLLEGSISTSDEELSKYDANGGKQPNFRATLFYSKKVFYSKTWG